MWADIVSAGIVLAVCGLALVMAPLEVAVKGQTKRHANMQLDALERTEGGRGWRITRPPAQSRRTTPARHRVHDGHKARRRAANRRARASRKVNRR